MESLIDRIKRGEILVADGAMGTMLFESGLNPGDCPEKLNIEKPELLEGIARKYLDAGADILQTNTFGGSPLKLEQYGLADKTEEINVASVEAVRSVVGDRAYVSASCGPSGMILKPYGDCEPDELTESFERQIAALVSAGIDMLCIETMTDLNEAVIAVRAARSVDSELTVAATMTFDSTPRGFYTIMGVSIAAAAAGLAEAGADIVGSNCGNGVRNMVEIAKEFRKVTQIPLLIQSNAGLPEMIDGKLTYKETPDFMAEAALELFRLGVSIVGGCCGTTPEHIAAIRGVADGLQTVG
jgi:5-methyltetrahydrofolate--homocysteine methyltransferase